MAKDMSYDAVNTRRAEIMKKAVGMDYDQYEYEDGNLSFNYDKMMDDAGYSLKEIEEIEAITGVGHTPLIELKNLSKLSRYYAPKGKGARIFIKDEYANPSSSFKARRAAIACYHAKKMGYKGVIAATSGNYGAAVASQAAKLGLKCIVVQECYDSRGVGQPEIIEKARACEAYGAEVLQLSVGPELFYTFLILLEETGFFNASLYSTYAIKGVETLGYEIAEECRQKYGKAPEAVVVTNAGGGNLTGTARGLLEAGAKDTQVIGASVDLSGLHMASDTQFNKKSFTTGHTGFGIPYSTWPDRSDVPRSAARPLRYLDRYVLTTQGSVFYITELLAKIEGIERGPAGNTSLACAFKLAQEFDEDAIIVVQETEYTGAGKHINPQLTFAIDNGIKLSVGETKNEVPGESIILPKDPSYVHVWDNDVVEMRKSLIRNAVKNHDVKKVTKRDIEFLVEDTKSNTEFVVGYLAELGVEHN
ncbi:MAG: PLP-dependent lyase/thiolase [Tissierellia bacterium]|nr:PLP-dependent lyase/thiolase [Tissierellia bacterium]